MAGGPESVRLRELSSSPCPCGHGPACGPRLGRDLLWNAELASYSSHNYRLGEIRGFLLLKTPKRSRSHRPLQLLWRLAPVPTLPVPEAWLGT